MPPGTGKAPPANPKPVKEKAGKGGKAEDALATNRKSDRAKQGRRLLNSAATNLQSSDDDSQVTRGVGANRVGGDTRKRTKKRHVAVTKKDNEGHEIVSRAVADIWATAWNICAERFFTRSASTTACVDLRNAWLRIIEAEWLDRDMFSTNTNTDTLFHQTDFAPLPLAFDSWSRGAITLLPKTRRESVMDPFLRDIEGNATVEEKEIPLDMHLDKPPKDVHNVVENRKPRVVRPPRKTKGADDWDFALDRRFKYNFNQGSTDKINDSAYSYKFV